MNLFLKTSIILLLMIVLLTGCGATGNSREGTSGIGKPDINDGDDYSIGQDNTENMQSDNNSSIGPGSTQPAETNPDDSQPADGKSDEHIAAKIKEMTLDEKIGQMFIIGFDGTVISEDLTDMLKSGAPGGVILFSRNVKDPEQLLELINSIKKINSGREPLFISVDEEGGRVSRMPEVLSDIPSAASLGEYGDIDITYDVGTLLGDEIAAFGFNMDFAPVLDILSNPDNTVIKERAFGNTAKTVSDHGIQLMKGIRNRGVIPVVKHFPGHGDTSVDSHTNLPIVGHDKERLSGFELVPFQKAIDENADVFMASHLLMKEIDPDNPASMSKAVITELLRNEMGFQGVVITDDMTMGAILKNYDIGDASVSSVMAGSDVILVCHGYDKQREAMDAVRSAVETGYIDEARIDESVARILRLKAKYGLEDRSIDNVDIAGLNKKIDGQLAKWYNVKEHF